MNVRAHACGRLARGFIRTGLQLTLVSDWSWVYYRLDDFTQHPLFGKADVAVAWHATARRPRGYSRPSRRSLLPVPYT